MAFRIKRREFIGLIGGATVAWPFVALAQKPDRSRRIGVLMSLGENDPEGKAQLSGFTQGLADLGWSDGPNLRMDVRWGGGDVNKIRTFAKELVAAQPDLILSQGTPVTAALQRETRTIPIVFVVVTDPVGEGFVAGLPLPGGNITGFITSEAAMGSKMLDLLLDIAPGINRVAMIFNPDTAPGGGKYYLGDFEAAARSSRIAPIAARAQSDAEIDTVVTSLGREPDGGLVVMPDFFMLNHVQPILLQAARSNVPTIYPWRYVVTKEAGLISYGPDFRDIVRRAAPYVDRILRGAKPADLPVQVPVKFEMAVNVKTAKALGLTVPTSLLLRADEVIE
ncbi:MAG TPA: ABC transporter substrate-binding protein [Bradyrhizobium sp.]|jgi:putative ABC transport system substrate-binding protein|nr:ABC transporter substrate-binding protein [Bradyrhizobium sp.]